MPLYDTEFAAEPLEYFRTALKNILGHEKVAANQAAWVDVLRNHKAAAGAVGVGGAAVLGVPGLGEQMVTLGRRAMGGARKYLGIERRVEEHAQQAAQMQAAQMAMPQEVPDPDAQMPAVGAEQSDTKQQVPALENSTRTHVPVMENSPRAQAFDYDEAMRRAMAQEAWERQQLQRFQRLHSPDFVRDGVGYWDPYAYAGEDRYDGSAPHIPEWQQSQQFSPVQRTIMRQSDDVLRAMMYNGRRLVRR